MIGPDQWLSRWLRSIPFKRANVTIWRIALRRRYQRCIFHSDLLRHSKLLRSRNYVHNAGTHISVYTYVFARCLFLSIENNRVLLLRIFTDIPVKHLRRSSSQLLPSFSSSNSYRTASVPATDVLQQMMELTETSDLLADQVTSSRHICC